MKKVTLEDKSCNPTGDGYSLCAHVKYRHPFTCNIYKEPLVMQIFYNIKNGKDYIGKCKSNLSLFHQSNFPDVLVFFTV